MQKRYFQKILHFLQHVCMQLKLFTTSAPLIQAHKGIILIHTLHDDTIDGEISFQGVDVFPFLQFRDQLGYLMYILHQILMLYSLDTILYTPYMGTQDWYTDCSEILQQGIHVTAGLKGRT